MKVVRALIQSVVEGVIKRFSASGRANEMFTNREYMQHYGFTSRPLSGSEGLVLIDGNTIYMIASDDRRYRVALEDGEVALYTDEGDKIHFKRNKEILITTGNKLTIDAVNEVVINTTTAQVNCTATATINASSIDLVGSGGIPKGIVQGDCICPITGLPHSDLSLTVRATK